MAHTHAWIVALLQPMPCAVSQQLDAAVSGLAGLLQVPLLGSQVPAAWH